MTTDAPALPDAEKLAIDYLLGVSELTDELGGPHVHAELPPAPALVWPLITLHRIGGTPERAGWPPRGWRDQARLTVYVWGEAGDARESVRHIAAVAQRALWRLPLEAPVQPLGVVQAVIDGGGPAWSPDSVTGRPRYTFDVEIHVRPREG